MDGEKRRSLAKAVCYRIICIISLSVVTYAITGDLIEMGMIVVVFQSLQMFIYYIHERVWNRVNWGRLPS